MICNSSPLIFLVKINKLEFLKKLFNNIIIPESVKDEILIKDREGYNSLENAIREKWIIIENPKKDVDLGIGKGENSAINLAQEKNEELIVDDLRAVKIAKSLNVNFIRTSDVLLLALKNKLINKEEAIQLFKELVKKKYYISPEIYLEIIKKIEFF